MQRLRERARRNHRSLQGELLAIVEDAVAPRKMLTPSELLAEVRKFGLSTPAESVAIIRADRENH
ncbi:MAG TPA: Arc family DNA-binding protein [Stellaceae bacterium]|nr:Arc family DNA-binding protein [Stellaceae bacterium]